MGRGKEMGGIERRAVKKRFASNTIQPFRGLLCAYVCQNTLTPLQGTGPVCIQSLTQVSSDVLGPPP